MLFDWMTIHLVLHALVPLLVAGLGFRKTWLKATVIMWLTMLVDLDHLLALGPVNTF
jgi:hypothetical protein